MSKLTDSVAKVRTFIEEVRLEMKKCSWPTRSELWESTVVVIVSVGILAVFVALCDLVLALMLRAIVR